MNTLHARLTILPGADLPTPLTDHVKIGLVPPNADGWKVIISGVVFTLLTALWTWMRLWSVRQNGRAFGVEDGFNLGAVFFFFSLISTDFVMVFLGGMGHNINDLQDWHVIRLLKAIFARQFLYVVTLGMVKLSILFMLMRIFNCQRFKRTTIAVIALTVACVLSTVLILLLICRPIAMNWQTHQTSTGTCGNEKAAFMVIGILDIINQLAILALPLPLIQKLGMETRYKIITALIFIIGILSLAFGITRLLTVLRTDFANLSYSGVAPTIYGSSESCIAIIVSSCPLLRPVFDRLLSVGGVLFGNSAWKNNKSGETVNMSRARRRSTISSGFTQIETQSRGDLELGNYGAHRSKRATSVTVGKRPTFYDQDDGSSMHRIVVTSETIVIRAKGGL